MLALARKIVNGDEEEDESVEEVFAQARQAEALSEELLVDEGWHAVDEEAEPIPAEVHRNGTSHAAAAAETGGYVGEASEAGQRSLFSWSEFLYGESEDKPSRRNGKPKPSTLSMFEWALSLEQQQEEELVGTGR